MITEESLWEDRGERFGISPVRPEYFKEEKENKMEKMMSEQVNELFTSLAKAQAEIKPAFKSEANPYFKSRYADLAAIIEAGRDALSKNGLAISQLVCYEDGKLMLKSILGHTSGQWVMSMMPLMMAKQTPQDLGSALTYAKRQSWAALTGISSTNEDDDGEQAQQSFREQEKASKDEMATEKMFWEALASDFDKQQDVRDFVKSRASKGKFSEQQVMISAINSVDKFLASFQKWLAEKESLSTIPNS